MPQLNPIQAMLTGSGTYATTLLTWFLDHYGDENDTDADEDQAACLTWTAETIRRELEQDFGIKLPPANLDRLMAAIAILTTDLFFTAVDRFIVLCNVLSGDSFDPQEFDPADTLECAWGITEAMLLAPPDEANGFSDEIRRYLAAVLQQESFVTPPDVLRLALHGDRSAAVSASFADDPEMYAALWQKNAEKTTEVNAMIRQGLHDLFDQLEALPLQRGTTRELVQRLRANLSSLTTSAQGEPHG